MFELKESKSFYMRGFAGFIVFPLNLTTYMWLVGCWLEKVKLGFFLLKGR
jgi:hypothetical protein